MILKCLSSWARIARPELFVTVSKKTALRSYFRAGLPTLSRPCVYCPMRFFSRSCGARWNGRGGKMGGVRFNGTPWSMSLKKLLAGFDSDMLQRQMVPFDRDAL